MSCTKSDEINIDLHDKIGVWIFWRLENSPDCLYGEWVTAVQHVQNIDRFKPILVRIGFVHNYIIKT